MLELGPVSSLFDIVTFAALFFVVCPATVGASWSELSGTGNVAGMATFAALFQSGWFVESMWSQTLVVHMLRSPHLPSPRDHAAPALCALTVLGWRLSPGCRQAPSPMRSAHDAAHELFWAAHWHRYRLYRAHPAGKAPLHCPPRRAAVASRRKTPCQLPLPLPQLPTPLPLPQSVPSAVAVE